MTLAALAKAVTSNRLLPWCVANCRKRKPDEAVARLWERSTLSQRIRFHNALNLYPLAWRIQYRGPLCMIDPSPRDMLGYRIRPQKRATTVVEIFAKGPSGTVTARFVNDTCTAATWRLVGCDPPPFAKLLAMGRR